MAKTAQEQAGARISPTVHPAYYPGGISLVPEAKSCLEVWLTPRRPSYAAVRGQPGAEPGLAFGPPTTHPNHPTYLSGKEKLCQEERIWKTEREHGGKWRRTALHWRDSGAVQWALKPEVFALGRGEGVELHPPGAEEQPSHLLVDLRRHLVHPGGEIPPLLRQPGQA